MGEPSSDGLVIGLKPRSLRVKAGGKFHYHLAIGSKGDAPRRLVLFSDREPIYRTRLRFEAEGVEPVEVGLVVPEVPTLATGAQIAIELQPREVSFSEGWVLVPEQFKDEFTVCPVLGGTDAMHEKVLGKPIRVTAV